MKPLDGLDRGAKYERLGRPLKETIPYVDLWKPGELVWPVDIPESLRTEDFYLGDFGSAMKLGDPVVRKCFPPVQFLSPGRLYGMHPSCACGMWSHMAVFAVLYLGQSPFHAFFEGGIMTCIVKCFGPLPEQWRGLYVHPKGLNSLYDQSGTPDPKHDLTARLAHFRKDTDPAERELVRIIMCKVFTYDLEKRLTATQLLHDPTFRALMNKYGC